MNYLSTTQISWEWLGHKPFAPLFFCSPSEELESLGFQAALNDELELVGITLL